MKKLILLFIFAFIVTVHRVEAQASQPFLGQISFVSFNFPPKGWAECNGQLMPINQNQALFSLLGTTYGGDGRTTFALPDMRGRAVVDDGQGNGLSNYLEGEKGGVDSVTLNLNQLPSHSHTVNAVTALGNTASPTGSLPANTQAPDDEYSGATADTTMNPLMLSSAGGNQPHENRPPFLVLKCIIAIQGIFPSQN